MKAQKLSTESKTKQDQKSSETDSSISLTFDSATDCEYKSGEISMHTSTSECISSLSVSECSSKLEQSVTFDSGHVSDCFSPMMSSEDITFEKANVPELLAEPLPTKDKFSLKEIFKQDKDGDTILHLAMVEARSDIIFPLIQLSPHPDFLDLTNDLFQTLLHLATLTGKSNIVRRLVVAGATLDIQDHNGNTPLHLASRLGDLDCVQAMLAPIEKYEIEGAGAFIILKA
ncbi:hypothetical protein JTE90_010781 [Oedothorax gibbosus]|uniref:Uncharacterized protein n=1 Tax=Oedothorax gibbosus TaxID=931172 RepID=A0AAV6THD1_9ARAC|nr:hypothetical protein JTE90_010781 [Oedothorax gibbosus]